MHLLTPGDVMPDMDFLGQRDTVLEWFTHIVQLFPQNLPVLTDGSDVSKT